MRLLAVERGERALAVEAGAALDDDRALALEQTLGARLGVAEGDPGAKHMVEPGLERRGDAEIVHRRSDHHDVGDRQLGDEPVGQSERGAGGVGVGGPAADRGDGLRPEVRDGLGADVAADDVDPVAAGCELRDEGTGELARHRLVAGRGAVDHENPGHENLLLSLQDRM